jgi:hypothetical protein
MFSAQAFLRDPSRNAQLEEDDSGAIESARLANRESSTSSGGKSSRRSSYPCTRRDRKGGLRLPRWLLTCWHPQATEDTAIEGEQLPRDQLDELDEVIVMRKNSFQSSAYLNLPAPSSLPLPEAPHRNWWGRQTTTRYASLYTDLQPKSDIFF